MVLSQEERILIRRAAERDREAFAILYLRYHDAVHRRVSALVSNQQEADDITSEAFLRAWNAIDRFEDRDVSILAWLSTIAQRLAFKQLSKRRPSLSLDDVSLEADGRESPEEVAERAVQAARLRRALVELPHLQREVLSKRFLEQLSYDEVGTALGKPVGTVRVIQHRALRALRSVLSRTTDMEGAKPAPTGASGE
ncbi:MAG TPA: sigma-70 family RNA polymerase sigma factor [Dehalococcoidia bacterium]|nr:sigma-70 family RNA polymerase sigma factor [Dehalococcoidia bacterium]